MLVDEGGQVHITDFGLAKRVDSGANLTGTGQVLGTPSYMSPEQTRGESSAIGTATDVYSIGAILYELLTARPPFRAQTPLETLMQVREGSPVAPTALNRSVPRELETICMKCLEKSPARRYASALELAQDLERFLSREPIHAQPAGRARRTLYWLERHPWSLTLVTATLLLGAVGLAFGMWSETRVLAWIRDHADYVREPGPLAAMAEALFIAGVVVQTALIWTGADCRRRSLGRHESPVGGGLTWREFRWRLDGDASWRKPIGRCRLATYIVVVAVSAGYALGWALFQIEAYVWERSVSFSSILVLIGLLTFGSYAAKAVFREYRAARDGLSIEKLWGLKGEA